MEGRVMKMFLSSISEQGFGPVSWHLSARDPASHSSSVSNPKTSKVYGQVMESDSSLYSRS